MWNNILITGGCGYVGSHTVVELVNLGYNCIIFDNLCNASYGCLLRCEEITGKKIEFIKGDLLDRECIYKAFEDHAIDGVIHFAGLKSVSESVTKPLSYYENNITGTNNLLSAMEKYQVKNIVFSSSATVYGNPQYLPLDEKHPVGNCSNPYGTTKYFIEIIISDCMKSMKGNFINLRYFNPIGAHETGKIGEHPNGIPNNLVPYIAQVACGLLSHINVFGKDYETIDGTGVRDYIHVVDLAKGHCKAINMLLNSSEPVWKTYNLGTGNGYTVLEVIKAYEKAAGKKIPYEILERRSGDIASCYADTSLAYSELGWNCQYDLDRMCEDSWRWQSNNPKGYE